MNFHFNSWEFKILDTWSRRAVHPFQLLNKIQPKTMPVKKFYSKWGVTVEQLAFLLEVSHSTISRWIKNGCDKTASKELLFQVDQSWENCSWALYELNVGQDGELLKTIEDYRKKPYFSRGHALFWEKIVVYVVLGELPEVNKLLNQKLK